MFLHLSREGSQRPCVRLSCGWFNSNRQNGIVKREEGLILVLNLRRKQQGIVHQCLCVQVYIVQIHSGDLSVFIGGVIIDSFLCIAAGGVDGTFKLSAAQMNATLGHRHSGKNMKELVNMGKFAFSRAGILA